MEKARNKAAATCCADVSALTRASHDCTKYMNKRIQELRHSPGKELAGLDSLEKSPQKKRFVDHVSDRLCRPQHCRKKDSLGLEPGRKKCSCSRGSPCLSHQDTGWQELSPEPEKHLRSSRYPKQGHIRGGYVDLSAEKMNKHSRGAQSRPRPHPSPEVTFSPSRSCRLNPHPERSVSLIQRLGQLDAFRRAVNLSRAEWLSRSNKCRNGEFSSDRPRPLFHPHRYASVLRTLRSLQQHEYCRSSTSPVRTRPPHPLRNNDLPARCPSSCALPVHLPPPPPTCLSRLLLPPPYIYAETPSPPRSGLSTISSFSPSFSNISAAVDNIHDPLDTGISTSCYARIDHDRVENLDSGNPNSPFTEAEEDAEATTAVPMVFSSPGSPPWSPPAAGADTDVSCEG